MPSKSLTQFARVIALRGGEQILGVPLTIPKIAASRPLVLGWLAFGGQGEKQWLSL
jgi:hypothetical protein